MAGLVKHFRDRAEASAYRLASKAVAYAAAAFAGVFGLGALFIWLAQTQSLLFASLCFAGGFLLIAIVAMLYAASMWRRGEELRRQQSSAIMSSMAFSAPILARSGQRLVGGLRRRPATGLLAALATAIVLVVLQRNNEDRG